MSKISQSGSKAKLTHSVKRHENLAIIGGKPLFSECLHVGRPNIGNQRRLMSRLKDMLDRRWLTNNGLYVKEFEKQVAKFLDVKHCIAMCNGTVALEIAVPRWGCKVKSSSPLSPLWPPLTAFSGRGFPRCSPTSIRRTLRLTP